MENNSNFEERFNLVMELNQTLEEIGNLNNQIKSLKYEYFRSLDQNNNIKEDLANTEKIWEEKKSKNQVLEKESKTLDDNINELKKELNCNNS